MGAGDYAELRLPVSILLDNVRSMYNVGAFFRTADGAGIERLLLSGITARPPKNGIGKTALGSENRVAWKPVEDVGAELRVRVQAFLALALGALAGGADVHHQLGPVDLLGERKGTRI